MVPRKVRSQARTSQIEPQRIRLLPKLPAEAGSEHPHIRQRRQDHSGFQEPPQVKDLHERADLRGPPAACGGVQRRRSGGHLESDQQPGDEQDRAGKDPEQREYLGAVQPGEVEPVQSALLHSDHPEFDFRVQKQRGGAGYSLHRAGLITHDEWTCSSY